MKAHMHLWHLL